MQAPHPGDYKAIVRAFMDNQQVGEETILFSVGEYSAELTDLQAQPTVLQSLSRVTGGQFVTPDSAQKLLTTMHGEKTITPISLESELWNNKILLVLILFFLTVEYTGYVFPRKHLTFRDQRRFIFSHKLVMLGFGTGVMGVLGVPFLQFFCIPLGVVGATQLWYDLSGEETAPKD